MSNETKALLDKMLGVNAKAEDKASAIMSVDDDENLQDIRLAKRLMEEQRALNLKMAQDNYLNSQIITPRELLRPGGLERHIARQDRARSSLLQAQLNDMKAEKQLEAMDALEASTRSQLVSQKLRSNLEGHANEYDQEKFGITRGDYSTPYQNFDFTSNMIDTGTRLTGGLIQGIGNALEDASTGLAVFGKSAIDTITGNDEGNWTDTVNKNWDDMKDLNPTAEVFDKIAYPLNYVRQKTNFTPLNSSSDYILNEFKNGQILDGVGQIFEATRDTLPSMTEGILAMNPVGAIALGTSFIGEMNKQVQADKQGTTASQIYTSDPDATTALSYLGALVYVAGGKLEGSMLKNAFTGRFTKKELTSLQNELNTLNKKINSGQFSDEQLALMQAKAKGLMDRAATLGNMEKAIAEKNLAKKNAFNEKWDKISANHSILGPAGKYGLLAGLSTAKFAGGTAMSMGTEALSEGIQTVAEQVATGKDLDIDEIKEAMTMGGIVGGAMHVGATPVRAGVKTLNKAMDGAVSGKIQKGTEQIFTSLNNELDKYKEDVENPTEEHMQMANLIMNEITRASSDPNDDSTVRSIHDEYSKPENREHMMRTLALVRAGKLGQEAQKQVLQADNNVFKKVIKGNVAEIHNGPLMEKVVFALGVKNKNFIDSAFKTAEQEVKEIMNSPEMSNTDKASRIASIKASIMEGFKIGKDLNLITDAEEKLYSKYIDDLSNHASKSSVAESIAKLGFTYQDGKHKRSLWDYVTGLSNAVSKDAYNKLRSDLSNFKNNQESKQAMWQYMKDNAESIAKANPSFSQFTFMTSKDGLGDVLVFKSKDEVVNFKKSLLQAAKDNKQKVDEYVNYNYHQWVFNTKKSGGEAMSGFNDSMAKIDNTLDQINSEMGYIDSISEMYDSYGKQFGENTSTPKQTKTTTSSNNKPTSTTENKASSKPANESKKETNSETKVEAKKAPESSAKDVKEEAKETLTEPKKDFDTILNEFRTSKSLNLSRNADKQMLTDFIVDYMRNNPGEEIKTNLSLASVLKAINDAKAIVNTKVDEVVDEESTVQEVENSEEASLDTTPIGQAILKVENTVMVNTNNTIARVNAPDNLKAQAKDKVFNLLDKFSVNKNISNSFTNMEKLSDKMVKSFEEFMSNARNTIKFLDTTLSSVVAPISFTGTGNKLTKVIFPSSRDKVQVNNMASLLNVPTARASMILRAIEALTDTRLTRFKSNADIQEDLENAFGNRLKDRIHWKILSKFNKAAIRKDLTEKIGKAVLKDIGLTAKGDSITELELSLARQEIGLYALRALEVNGYVSIDNSVKSQDVFNDSKEGKENSSVPLVRLTPKGEQEIFSKTEESSKMKEAFASITNLIQELGVDRVFPSKNYSTTPLGEIQGNTIQTTHGKAIRVPDAAIRALNRRRNTKFVAKIADDFKAFMSEFGITPDILYKSRTGYTDLENSKDLLPSQKDSKKGKNISIENSINYFLDFINDESTKDGVYFDYKMSNNFREFLQSSSINPQTDKFARFLLVAENMYSDYKIANNGDILDKNGKVHNVAYQALAQSFGFGTDKNLRSSAIQLGKDIASLDYNLLRQAIADSIKNPDKKHKLYLARTEGMSKEQTEFADKLDSLDLNIEELGHALSAMNALKAYHEARANGKDTFNAAILSEVDGINNGLAIKLLQYMLDPSYVELLRSAGIDFYNQASDAIADYFSGKGSEKINDLYKLVAKKIGESSKKLSEDFKSNTPTDEVTDIINNIARGFRLDTDNMDLPSLYAYTSKVVDFVSDMYALDEDGNVTNNARINTKPIATVFGYGAGALAQIRKLRNTLMEDLPQKAYEYITKKDYSAKAKQAYELIKATYTFTGKNISNQELMHALKSDLGVYAEKVKVGKRTNTIGDVLGNVLMKSMEGILKDSMQRTFPLMTTQNNITNTVFNNRLKIVQVYFELLKDKFTKGLNRDLTVSEVAKLEKLLQNKLPFVRLSLATSEDIKKGNSKFSLQGRDSVTNYDDKGTRHVATGYKVKNPDGSIASKFTDNTLHGDEKAYGNVGASANVISIHQEDGSVMLLTVDNTSEDLAFLGVHDAFVVDANSAVEINNTANRLAFETNKGSRTLSIIAKMADDSIALAMDVIELAKELGITEGIFKNEKGTDITNVFVNGLKATANMADMMYSITSTNRDALFKYNASYNNVQNNYEGSAYQHNPQDALDANNKDQAFDKTMYSPTNDRVVMGSLIPMYESMMSDINYGNAKKVSEISDISFLIDSMDRVKEDVKKVADNNLNTFGITSKYFKNSNNNNITSTETKELDIKEIEKTIDQEITNKVERELVKEALSKPNLARPTVQTLPDLDEYMNLMYMGDNQDIMYSPDTKILSAPTRWKNTFGLNSIHDKYIAKISPEIKKAIEGREIEINVKVLYKIMRKRRDSGKNDVLNYIKETLETPDFIIRDNSNSEQGVNFLFGKEINGQKFCINVIGDVEGIVSIKSSSIRNANNINNKLRTNKATVVYIAPEPLKQPGSLTQSESGQSPLLDSKTASASSDKGQNNYSIDIVNKLKNKYMNSPESGRSPQDTDTSLEDEIETISQSTILDENTGSIQETMSMLRARDEMSGQATNKEHSDRLKDLLSKLITTVNKAADGVKVILEESNSRTNGGNFNAILNKIIIRSSNSQDYRGFMSREETGAHELTHAAIHYALRYNDGKNHLVNTLGQMYRIFLSNVTVEKLAKAFESTTKSPEEALRAANKVWEHITKHDHLGNLEEFLTLSVTNDAMYQVMKDIEYKEYKGNGSLWSKIVNVFLDTFDRFFGEGVKNAKRGDKLHIAITALAVEMSAVNQKAKAGNKAKLIQIDEKAASFRRGLDSKVSNWIKGVFSAGADKVAMKILKDLANSGINVNMTTKEFKNFDRYTRWQITKDIVKLTTLAYLHPQFKEMIQNTAPMHHMFSYDSTLGAIVEDLSKPNAIQRIAQRIQRKSSRIDAKRNNIEKIKSDTLRELFGNNIDKKDAQILGETILDTDLSSLNMNAEELSTLLSSKENITKAIKNKVKELDELIKSEFKTKNDITPEMYSNFIKNRSKALATYMVSNIATDNALLRNAANIANLETTGVIHQASDSMIQMIDEYITLLALSKTNTSMLNRTAQIAKDNAQAFDNLLTYHRNFKEASLENNFTNNARQMIKGYRLEILNELATLKIAKIDEADVLASQGFKMITNGLPKDSGDGFTAGRALFVNTFIEPQAKFNRQGVRYTEGDKRGTGLDDIYNKELMDKTAMGRDITAQYKLSLETLTNKQKAAIKRAFANPMPKAEADTAMIPVIDENGNISTFTYIMSKDVKHDVLAMDTDIFDSLGKMEASMYDKMSSKALNDEIADILIDDYNSNGNKSGNAFMELSLNSKDPLVREIYKMLPYDLRTKLEGAMGGRIRVRKQTFRKFFGVRDLDIRNTKWYQSSNRSALEKQAVVLAIEVVKKIGKFFGLEVVMKNPVVFGSNQVSNFVQCFNHGMSMEETFRLHKEGIENIRRYQRLVKKLLELETQEKAGKKVSPELKKAIRNDLQSNPVYPLVKNGFYNTIAEDLDSDNLDYLETKMKAGYDKLADFGKLGIGIQKSFDWAFLTSNTSVGRALNEYVHLADFISRYALYHGLKKQGKLSEDEIIDTVSDAFIDYDSVTSRSLKLLNDMKLLLFTRFFTRSQRLLTDHLVNRPVSTASHLLTQYFSGINLPDIFDTNVFSKDILGMGSTPWANAKEVISAPIMNFIPGWK